MNVKPRPLSTPWTVTAWVAVVLGIGLGIWAAVTSDWISLLIAAGSITLMAYVLTIDTRLKRAKRGAKDESVNRGLGW